jgi:1-aminocyclopropane-1-carboxylate deaminase/D-cysteine desulfhydrase-like pyridoxal-dependent ACC family enzyme
MALDVFSRAELDGVTLADSARELAKLSPDVSVVVMATGSLGELGGIRHAASHFAPQVNVIALQVEEGATAGMASLGSITILTLGRLAELPIILAGGRSR